MVGAGLLLLSNLIVVPAAAPFPGHGERFAAMAADPFAFAGEIPQRLLWPLLAWLFGHLGVGVLAFSSICNAALIATVFWFARRRTDSLLDAGLVAAAIAASGAVLVYKPMMCYSDSLNLLLLVLLLHFAARPRVYWSLVLVAAFSHETVYFFTPWLLYLRLQNCGQQNGGQWWPEVARWALGLAVYGGFRVVLMLTGHAGSYDLAYYFDNAIWVPWLLPAIWFLWGFVVLVEFGPLLVGMFAAGWNGELAKPTGMGGPWWPWLYWPSVLALMLLAYDVMRFAPFALPPVLLGLLFLLRTPGGRGQLAGLIVLQVVCYLWLHPIASEQGGRHFTEVAAYLWSPENFVLLVTRGANDAVTLQVRLLTQFWSYAIVALLALVAMVLLGCRLASRREHAPQPIVEP